MSRFSVHVENILTEAGWYPGRQMADLVASWKVTLMASDGFQMFPTAERVLLEFGGLSVTQQEPGEMCSVEPFTLDPTLAVYEGDRFHELSSSANTRLYPLGEASNFHQFLAIGENDFIYLLMNDLNLLGKNIDEALERLLRGF